MKIIILLSLTIILKADLIKKEYKEEHLENRKKIINLKIKEFKSLEKKEQLKEVNSFFNKYIKYESDQKLYGKHNHIATLEETIKTMKGDCDDYVLAKLQALDYLGFKENKIFFNTENGIRHVKIISKLNDKYYVLDSLNKTFRKLKKEELKEKDIKIYDYSIYMKIKELRKI